VGALISPGVGYFSGESASGAYWAGWVGMYELTPGWSLSGSVLCIVLSCPCIFKICPVTGKFPVGCSEPDHVAHGFTGSEMSIVRSFHQKCFYGMVRNSFFAEITLFLDVFKKSYKPVGID